MWVKVKDFDREVKVGDRIKVEDARYIYHEGIFTGKGRSRFFMDEKNEGETVWELDYEVQVWREPVRWFPKVDECFFYTYSDGGSGSLIYSSRGCGIADDLFKSGNLWKSLEKEREYADECKKLAEKLHEKWGE